jgi:hypothetical protein
MSLTSNIGRSSGIPSIIGKNLQLNGILDIYNQSAGSVPLTIRGAFGQTAKLLELKNYAGTSVFYVDVSGNVTYLGDEYITDKLTVNGDATIGGTLEVTGATTLSSTLNVIGNSTLGDTETQFLDVVRDLTLRNGYLRSASTDGLHIVPAGNTITIVGDVGTVSTHSLTANNDLLIGGKLEVNGQFYSDLGATFIGSTTFSKTATPVAVDQTISVSYISAGNIGSFVQFGGQTNTVTGAATDDANSVPFAYNATYVPNGSPATFASAFVVQGGWKNALISLNQDLEFQSVINAGGDGKNIIFQASAAQSTGSPTVGGSIYFAIGEGQDGGANGTINLNQYSDGGTRGETNAWGTFNLKRTGTATSGVPEYDSSPVFFESSAWNTTGAGSVDTHQWRIFSDPVGNQAPTFSSLAFDNRVNGGSWLGTMTLYRGQSPGLTSGINWTATHINLQALNTDDANSSTSIIDALFTKNSSPGTSNYIFFKSGGDDIDNAINFQDHPLKITTSALATETSPHNITIQPTAPRIGAATGVDGASTIIAGGPAVGATGTSGNVYIYGGPMGSGNAGNVIIGHDGSSIVGANVYFGTNSGTAYINILDSESTPRNIINIGSTTKADAFIIKTDGQISMIDSSARTTDKMQIQSGDAAHPVNTDSIRTINATIYSSASKVSPIQGNYYSCGLAASELAEGVGANLFTHASDAVGSFGVEFSAVVDKTAGGGMLTMAFGDVSAMSTGFSNDVTLGVAAGDVKIAAVEGPAVNNGHNVWISGSDGTVTDGNIFMAWDFLNSVTLGNVAIGTNDLDGTPSIGRLTVEALTSDGSSNAQVWRDSSHANIAYLNSDGTFQHSGALIENVTTVNAAACSFTPAYITGAATTESDYTDWVGISDGSFAITINGVARAISGLNFTAVGTMDDVAAVIQAGIRTATGSTETCIWSTDHFVISSANTTSSSAITVTSATGSGTDISGGVNDFLDMDAGNGTVTAKSGATYTLLSTDRSLAIDYTATGPVAITWTASLPVGMIVDVMDTGANTTTYNITLNRSGSETFTNATTGNTSLTISSNGDSLTLQKVSSTVWFVK